ncbi:MAG: riboflavin biosynthesis protein RibD [Rhodospirillaceae bacterium]|nr:riboflavin biosynthesis protein RibD [Rhodospirillaceae bacterium]
MLSKDIKWMNIALRLADRNIGNVYPNPSVGCLIIKNDRVVGRGWTQLGGRPHAEAMALRQAGPNAKGATVYSTLEPCSHFGQTPPCCDALIAAGIKRLVGGMRDPDPRVNGNGFLKLRQAGIEVTDGIQEGLATELNNGFVSKIKNKTPIVTLKLATSIDSKISTKMGESKWITGNQARHSVHFQRSRHDAILTGIGTVIADDPMLNCRLKGLENRSPVRVILDTKLKISAKNQIASSAAEYETIVFTTNEAKHRKQVQLEKLGIKIERIEMDKNGRVLINSVLATLAGNGITSVLVESGGQLAAEFIRLNLVDYLLVYCAPIVIGGDGGDAIASVGLNKLDMAFPFERIKTENLGIDLLETYKRRV